MFKENDKVKAPIKDKLTPGIVQRVEDAKGFRGYAYQKVWVMFEDETVLQFRDYDIHLVTDEVVAK
jgi:hypothetical protein